MLGLYVPKPIDFWIAITVLGAVFLVLCALASRLNGTIGVAAIWIFFGGVLAITPDLFTIWNIDSDEYGRLVRAFHSTKYSNRFLAITSYLYAGWGPLFSVCGMVVGLVIYSAIHRVALRRSRQSHGASRQDK